MYSIGITTFKYRFDKYLVPLIQSIREQTPSEIILGVNGEYKESFDDVYRFKVLDFCAETFKVFPFIYPNFRSLAKMWNNIIINATNDYVLVLNDDLVITDPLFFQTLQGHIDRIKTSFTINGTYSSFVIKKSSMTSETWFDERYLGIGCEDHDYRNRIASGKIVMDNVWMDGFKEFTDPENAVVGQKKENGKYSLFNRELFNKGLPEVDQYPHEQFYLENYDKL